MKANKIGLGLIAEKALVTILKSIFRDSFIQYNDFKNYNNGIGKGTDIKIDHTFDIEVKNWRLYNKPYGHDIIQKEIVDRFQHSACRHKIVFISFSNSKRLETTYTLAYPFKLQLFFNSFNHMP